MVRYRKIDLETSVILRIEHQRYGKSTYELAAERGLPQKTVYRHAIKPIVDLNQRPLDKRKFNKGRPRLLSERDERDLKRSVQSLRKSQGLCFSADQVRQQAGWACSRRTAAKYLHRRANIHQNIQCLLRNLPFMSIFQSHSRKSVSITIFS